MYKCGLSGWPPTWGKWKKQEQRWEEQEEEEEEGRKREEEAGGNLPLMTPLIFLQRLEPVTTEHLVPQSSTQPHTLNDTHTHIQTPCPDLHVCLLVHTGSNDTRASHRSILSCHSAGKRTHTHTHVHTQKQPDRCRHTHTHMQGGVYVCTFVYAGSDVFYNLSRCPLPSPLADNVSPTHTQTHPHWTKAIFSFHSRFLILLPSLTEKSSDVILINEDGGCIQRAKSLWLYIINYHRFHAPAHARMQMQALIRHTTAFAQESRKKSVSPLLLSSSTSFSHHLLFFFLPPPLPILSPPLQQSQAPIRLSPHRTQVPLRKPDWKLEPNCSLGGSAYVWLHQHGTFGV